MREFVIILEIYIETGAGGKRQRIDGQRRFIRVDNFLLFFWTNAKRWL